MPLQQPAWTCSNYSTAASEPLIGSAPRVDAWLLLEYRDPWERNALEASAIPQPVKDALLAAERAIPNARLELIRQETRRGRDGIAFFVARSSPSGSALYRFDLRAYEDVLELDLPAVVNGDARFEAQRAGEPLFVVCTNGRRDACCARNGLPLARAMAQAAPGGVWECTHLGGHRLGPNVVSLPDGLMYGRVQAGDVGAILDSSQINLDLLRGRSCFDPPAQAAEFFVRAELNIRAATQLLLDDVSQTGPGQWTVTLRLGDLQRNVRVEQAPAGYATFTSCGDKEPKEILEFRLVGIG